MMAELTTAMRQKIWRGLMRWWSNLWELTDLSKSDLQAAINATDTWIENNQGGFNSALPSAAQSGLTTAQKTLMFCAVALARVDETLLRLVFGEVD
jgi:hypothetical protein